MPELTIVIVNYKTADLTVDCLASVVGDETVPASTRIVVADNASPSGDATTLDRVIGERGWRDRVTLLALPENGGFAAGNNRAIEMADATFGPSELYYLLNPDTVCRPGAVAALVAFLRGNPQVGIVGSRLEDPDGTRQACAFRFLTVASEFEAALRFGPVTRLLDRWQVAPQLPSTPCQVGWVCGASLMFRREVMDRIGPLDETYFLYYEELDFCLRAARAGWPSWYVPESRVVHLVGQSTGLSVRNTALPRRPAYWFHSRRHFFVKNHGRAYTLLADLAFIAGQAGFRLRQLVSPTGGHEPPRLIRDFIRHSWFARGA